MCHKPVCQVLPLLNLAPELFQPLLLEFAASNPKPIDNTYTNSKI